MDNNYALRYRFFFRSAEGHGLYPKVLVRSLTYVALVAVATLAIALALPASLRLPFFQFGFPERIALVYLSVWLFGEVALRAHLEAERERLYFGLKAIIIPGYSTVVPYVVFVTLNPVAHEADWANPDAPLFSGYWLFVGMLAATMASLLWLLLWWLGKRYFPFAIEEAEYLYPLPADLVVPKRKQKEFMQWYKRDEFDEELFDAKYADWYSEESYHAYRMGAARQYLEAQPYRLHDPDNALPTDVVFVLMHLDDAPSFVRACALTVHNGDLVLEQYWKEFNGTQVFRIRYGDEVLSLSIRTRFRDLNRLVVGMAELVAPGYGIRQCRVLRRGACPFFMSLPEAEWKMLEAEYGMAKMNRYFKLVDARYKGLSYYGSWLYKAKAFIFLPAAQHGGSRSWHPMPQEL